LTEDVVPPSRKVNVAELQIVGEVELQIPRGLASLTRVAGFVKTNGPRWPSTISSAWDDGATPAWYIAVNTG